MPLTVCVLCKPEGGKEGQREQGSKKNILVSNLREVDKNEDGSNLEGSDQLQADLASLLGPVDTTQATGLKSDTWKQKQKEQIRLASYLPVREGVHPLQLYRAQSGNFVVDKFQRKSRPT